MNGKSILGTGFALLLMTLRASGGTVPLGTISYNFQLAGGGGGATATLNGVPVEIFCDDFANDVNVPSDNSADVTVLGTGANLGATRFGGMSSTSWAPISISDGNTTLDNLDNTFFNSGNGSSALARYDMVAYLVSLYNLGQGGNTSNNQIQEAIWTILDPSAEKALINPDGVNAAGYLEQAVSWYTSMNANQAALNSFLSNFEIVSSSNMTFSNGLGIGGFQEQIVMTPEPRGGALILLSLLAGALLVVRRKKVSRATPSLSL
jgi:hypothetical protein